MDLSSQVKLLTEENKNLRDELQQKSDFISIMVHQLRTPLSAAKWVFKMMMDGDLGTVTDAQRTIIKRGFESNEQMIKLLADISHANHISEWKLHFQIVPMDIGTCIQLAIGEFTGEAREHHVALRFDPKPLPHVMADPEKICLVVQNLIENAIKYNRAGGSVTIVAEPFQDTLVISVRDTGIGIPVNDQKNITGKFYRASNVKDKKGTGLGLFVAQQIVTGHHGTLWFESVPDIGTTFFFSLPLAK